MGSMSWRIGPLPRFFLFFAQFSRKSLGQSAVRRFRRRFFLPSSFSGKRESAFRANFCNASFFICPFFPFFSFSLFLHTLFLIARKSVEKADDRGCGNAVRISESDVVKVISVDRGVIRLAHTAFTETREEKESGGETALIPAHSMKEKIPEYRSVPVADAAAVCLLQQLISQPIIRIIYSTPTDKQINARNDRFVLPPSPDPFFVTLLKNRSIRSIFFTGVNEKSRGREGGGRGYSRGSRSRSIHDGASSRARSVQQAASPVSGRSGANRRIGGKMAKVSRESRGGAAARPAHRRILVLLAPIPPKIPDAFKNRRSRFENATPLFLRAVPIPFLQTGGRNRNFRARGERIN